MAICRLPSELLQLTFSYCVGEQHKDFKPGLRYGNGRCTRKNSSCTPFHLSLVCRQWYSLVVGNPDLWSTIHIHHPQPHDVPIFKLWLQRSGDQLLTLSIHEDFSNTPPIHSDIPTPAGNFTSDSLFQQKRPLLDIVELATGVSERWKVIHLSLSEDVGRVFQEEGFEESDFPNLESFVVDMRAGELLLGDPSGGTPIHALCRRLCSSAKLRSAKWESDIDEGMRAYVPFNRLTSLSLAKVTDSEATLILSDCQELITLEVRHYCRPRPGEDEEQMRSPIVLPRLQFASLRFLEETNAVPAFFTKFLTPSLQELRLERGFGRRPGSGVRVTGNGGLGVGDEKGWIGLIKFLERSECKLKKLVFCPEEELSPLETSEMRRHLKDRVFSELNRSSLRRGPGSSRWMSSCDGLEECY